MYTKDELISQLKTLGLQPGDLVMLHASIRAIGRVAGGPDQIHQAVFDSISPQGTLMMYVGCPPELEVGTTTRFFGQASRVLLGLPSFEPGFTRANPDYGTLAELFRRWPGVICSDNPVVRMAALGDKAKWLTADHPINYGYGADSPLEKLYQNKGKILLLGSDLGHVTLLHYAEYIAPIENKKVIREQVPTMKNGKRDWVEIEDYDSDEGICPWPAGFFNNVVEDYLAQNNISAVKIGSADSYLLDAKSLVDFAVPILCETAPLPCLKL
jgi:aminoglycoside 3-N-acetyltransferase